MRMFEHGHTLSHVVCVGTRAKYERAHSIHNCTLYGHLCSDAPQILIRNFKMRILAAIIAFSFLRDTLLPHF